MNNKYNTSIEIKRDGEFFNLKLKLTKKEYKRITILFKQMYKSTPYILDQRQKDIK